MNIRTALFVTTSLLGALALAACDSGDGGTGGSGGAGGDTTTTTSSGTAGGGGSTGDTGWIRLAHMSSDSQAIDFCVTGSDGTTQGPLGAASYNPAGDTAMDPMVTAYVEVRADSYQVDIIAQGQDCTGTPVGSIGEPLVLAAGGYQTVIVDGLQANGTLGVGSYEDKNTPDAGSVYLNVCHENPGAGPVQVGTVDATTDAFTSILNDAAGTITLDFTDCASVQIPMAITMGTIIGLSTNGTDADVGRWTVPAALTPDTATNAATVFAYGADAATVGLYACLNSSNTCLSLPSAAVP